MTVFILDALSRPNIKDMGREAKILTLKKELDGRIRLVGEFNQRTGQNIEVKESIWLTTSIKIDAPDEKIARAVAGYTDMKLSRPEFNLKPDV